MNLEIERKFLLSELPSVMPTELFIITQLYLEREEGYSERIRMADRKEITSPVFDPTIFTHTIKKYVSDGVYEETEKVITKEEYDVISKNNPDAKVVLKNRYVYPHNELKWEIDTFHTDNLTIAEIELPNEEYILEIPEFITNVMVKEVTGDKQYKNENIAKKNPWCV